MSENNILLSIICPIYNSAKYLSECLESLKNQSYSDFQLILIDDCSTDNSYDIALSFSKKFKNFLLIKNTQNKGVSYSRNKGLDNAIGDFIIFVDSDDLVDFDLTGKIIGKITNFSEPWSLLYYNVFRIKDKKDLSNKLTNYKKSILNKDLLIKYILDERKLGGYIYNKVFKSEIIKKHQVRFDEDIYIAEDEVFCLNYLKFIDKELAYSVEGNYFYRDNPNSITAKVDSNKIENLVKARCKAYELLDDNSVLAYYYLVISLIYLSIVLNNRLISCRTILKSLKLFFNRYIKFKDKICVLLYLFSFKLVKIVYDKRH